MSNRWSAVGKHSFRHRRRKRKCYFTRICEMGSRANKHSRKIVPDGLPGFEPRPKAVTDDRGECNPPIRYGFRSFDRQWIIPDNRLINQPNPELWKSRSEHQVYVTAFTEESPKNG